MQQLLTTITSLRLPFQIVENLPNYGHPYFQTNRDNVSHQSIYPKEEMLGKIVQLRFREVRTATSPRRIEGGVSSSLRTA